MTQPMMPVPSTEPLTPVEAELVRRAQSDYDRTMAEASAARQKAAQLVAAAHGMAAEQQWTIRSGAQGLELAFLPMPERQLALVKDADAPAEGQDEALAAP